MKKKLKELKKGDYINLFKRNGESFVWKVKYIEFRKEQAFDLILENREGEEKSYGFLDWNMEIESPEQISVCECCGHIKEI